MGVVNQLEVARQYIARGIRVFPCNPTNKAPLTRTGFKEATTDLAQVEEWWDKHPNALIGSPDESFVVLDIDDYDLDPSSRFIVDGVKTRLFSDKIITDEHPQVKTMSGGTHVYFKNTESLTRRIKSLPQIDILGRGGYVILPDQTNYKCVNMDAPWSMFDDLKDIRADRFESLCEEYSELTKSVTRAVKAYRTGETVSSGASKRKAASSEREVELRKRNRETFAQLVEEESETDINLAYLDYESNTIQFEIKKGIYSPVNEGRVFNRADSGEKLLDENGRLNLDVTQLDSAKINRIFHNREVQAKLCELVGVKAPRVGTTKTIKSVLPGHVDSAPSMGVRWDRSQSHLIFRDFSNHYADKHNQVDYNVVRLYCTIKYGTNVPKLRGPEFVVWFTRMLCEAGMIDIAKHQKEYAVSLNKLTEHHRKVAEGFLLLDAVKSLYQGYSGETVFADKFGMAWCGVSLATVNRAKKSLVDKGILYETGEHDCHPNRKDGFFKTKLYQINAKEEDMKLDEAISTTGISRVDLKVKHVQSIERRERKEQEVEDRYPELVTVVGLEIGEQFREKVKHFVEDFDLEEVPAAGNMFVPLLVSERFQEVQLPEQSAMTTFFANNFVVEPVEGIDDPSKIVVVARCESPPLEKFIEKLNKEYENDMEESDISFVISIGMIPEEMGDYDWDYLTLKFNEYVDYVSGSEIFVRHLNDAQAKQFLDGEDPMEDDDD